MKKLVITILIAIAAITADAQCQYCNTYEDFLDNRWQQLDTIYCKSNSQSRQLWLGGSDYTLTTGDKTLDEILKKEAFAVMLADTIYVNCRNLRYEKGRFGSGYTKAMRIGQNNLLFVGRVIGSAVEYFEPLYDGMTGAFGGAIGGAISASEQVKLQVCYVISSGADSKGHIGIRLLNDSFMDQLIDNRKDLHDEYYAEKNRLKRLLANHVIPILEKADLFQQEEQGD